MIDDVVDGVFAVAGMVVVFEQGATFAREVASFDRIRVRGQGCRRVGVFGWCVVWGGVVMAVGMANVVFGGTSGLVMAPVGKGINRALYLGRERFGQHMAGGTDFKAETVFVDLGQSLPTPPTQTQHFIRKTTASAHYDWLRGAGIVEGLDRPSGQTSAGATCWPLSLNFSRARS